MSGLGPTARRQAGRRAARLLVAVALAALPQARHAAAQEVPDEGFLSSASVVRVGHWIEIRGHLEPDGRFVGEEAEILEPEEEERLIGTVEEAAGPAPRLLGHRLVLTRDTRWRGLEPAEVGGRRVRVDGIYAPGTDRFVVDEVRSRRPGRDRIEGRVDRVVAIATGIEVRVLGLRALLPAAVRHEHRLEAIPLAPRRLGSSGPEVPSEDDLLGAGVVLGESLRLKGQLDLRLTREDNFDLDDEDAEDRSEARGATRLRLEWVPAGRFGVVVETRVTDRYRDDEDDGSSNRDEARLGEAYVYLHDALGPGLDLQIGRQDFDDAREWLYDQDLDAVRLISASRRWRLELSVSSTLIDGSERDSQSTDWMLYLSNNSRRRHLAVYGIHRELAEGLDGNALHVGFRMLGKWLPDNEIWLEAAGYGGSGAGTERRGWGLDVGTTWTPDAVDRLALTVGHAFGSGDADPGATDHTFRQTGFQDNNGKFDGVSSFRYYGELVDPELANLAILTVGIGVRPARRRSLDLVFHRYRQDEASPRLIESELDRRPDGVHRDLGWELDLVFGDRHLPSWDVEIVAGYFAPGRAFDDDDDPAMLAKAQVRYRF